MNFRVLANRDLGEEWFELQVDAPELASKVKAGQFVQIEVGEPDEPMVRRPFSVFDVRPEPGASATTVVILYQRVGPGTRWMSRLRVDDPVDLLGPLGKPLPSFDLPDDGELFLVGGGIGVAPLFFYARQLQLQGDSAPRHRVLLGARRKSLLIGLDAFEERGIPTQASTDDGSHGHHGNVVELLEQCLDARTSKVAGIGCGPHGMNVALRDYAVDHDLEFWISLENYMPCGFGACFGCVIPAPPGAPSKYRRVCLEGPAFPAHELPADL